jgi:quercetin dioxygenase-like cupin family protein
MRRTILRNAAAGCVIAALAAGGSAALAQAGADPARVRLAPDDYLALETIKDRGGAPGALPLESRILKGDPSRLGLYTILLKIPPHTRIPAHWHPDERVGTVVGGTLYFGYGDRFNEDALKALPAGSFYVEPANIPHFSRTGDTEAVVQVTGVGPTGTNYVDPARQRFDSTR